MLAVASVSLGACRPREQPAHPVRWAKAWINALNSHRSGYFPSLLGPRGTYEDPLTGGPRSGVDFRLYMRVRWARLPDLRYEIERVTGDGNVVAVEWKATGLPGRPKEKPLRGAFVIHLQGNSIASVRGYYDTLPITSLPG